VAYPTAAQMRGDLAGLAANNSFCSVMTLKQSVNGTDITALKISKVVGSSARTKVLFTGGVHANEWAPPRALVSLAKTLLDAYAAPKGIAYGAFSLTPQDVKDIIENVDIYIAPMINPDGYALSLSLMGAGKSETRGRKNGRFTGPCLDPGVNINRNCDIVWDFEKLYATPPASNVATSSDPCHYNYSGIHPGPAIGSAFSEPEAQNIKTLLDEGIEFYVDCHMYGPTVLHSWGIGTNQTTTSAMSFSNSAYDGKRPGTVTPIVAPAVDYKEYIPAAELVEVSNLATRMQQAIKDGTDVPGRSVYPYTDYVVQPGAQFYPTSGSADDYAYSRHLANSTLPFVRAYTIECGDSVTTGFRPTEPMYVFVEQELHCALLALLKTAAAWIGKRNSSSSSSCPIALLLGVAHPTVEALRQLRDVAFRETALGSRVMDTVVRLYAVVSPALVRWLAPRPRLRAAIKRFLARPVLETFRVSTSLAMRLPTPTLRVTALLTSLAVVGALPCLLLLALWVGVRYG
jgi:zinc carboxypeptidase